MSWNSTDFPVGPSDPCEVGLGVWDCTDGKEDVQDVSVAMTTSASQRRCSERYPKAKVASLVIAAKMENVLLPSVRAFVCVCLRARARVYACMYVFSCACTLGRKCEGQRNILPGAFFKLSSLTFKWDRLSRGTQGLPGQLEWLANKRHPALLAFLPPQCWTYRFTLLCSAFDVGASDSNSGPIACAESALATEPSP